MPPHFAKFIKNINLWWGSTFRGKEFGLSILRAQKLHKASLRRVEDMWDIIVAKFHLGK
jgi:hypothetical protein